jgi:hypothetical protein
LDDARLDDDRFDDERFDDERFDDFDEDLPDDELITAPRFSLTTGCGQKNQSSKESRRQMRAWVVQYKFSGRAIRREPRLVPRSSGNH